MAYKKVEMGNAYDFEENPELEGEYLGKQEDVGPNHSNLYTIKDKATGENVAVWGSTALDTKMTMLPPGAKVLIKYLGKKASQKRPGSVYKDFEVHIWEE